MLGLQVALCVNRPGFELTPSSWTVMSPPIRRRFSIGIPPD